MGKNVGRGGVGKSGMKEENEEYGKEKFRRRERR